jgi:NTP pyrophosphatase (non-canonical NTP hydrolase)
MVNDGLTKLVEECGELVQAAAKMIAYPNVEYHPDGSNQRERLSMEIADVVAACRFVANKLELDRLAIEHRIVEKLRTYRIWDEERA